MQMHGVDSPSGTLITIITLRSTLLIVQLSIQNPITPSMMSWLAKTKNGSTNIPLP